MSRSTAAHGSLLTAVTGLASLAATAETGRAAVPDNRFADALNRQIGEEFAASQQYVAIAVHYDALTLPRLASHFYAQAVEERNHAMMVVQYLLDPAWALRGPTSTTPSRRSR